MKQSRWPWLITIVALVVATGGVSYGAAQRYIITSKNQISPKVRAQLKGARGKIGPAGPAGAPGATGAAGATGATGPAGAARAWGTVVISGTGISIANGTGNVTVRNPSVGIWCLSAPAGVSPDEAIMVAPNTQVIVVGQTGRTVCNTSEFQVFTSTTGATLTNGQFNFLIP